MSDCAFDFDDEEDPEPGDQLLTTVDGLRSTDVGNGKRLIRIHGERLRFVHGWNKWIVFTDGRWVVDANGQLVRGLAKDVARQLFGLTLESQSVGERDELFKAAKRAESAGGLSGMVACAASEQGILVEHEKLDADPFILNIKNGEIDLRTGQWSPFPNPHRLCTKQAPIWFNQDPAVQAAPLWNRCLERWQPDPEMRDYLQLEAGAAATGHHTETLSIHYGSGGNGKSKYFGALQHVLGDYALNLHKSLVLQKRFQPHDTEKARLFGARLAVVSETGTSERLNAEEVKNLTGGDRLSARRMREDPWEFNPSHTLVMLTNHRPIIADQSDGMWRRVRIIPWEVTIPPEEIDATLGTKLEHEALGILLWVVEGARRFIEGGFQLPMPQKVAVATASYRSTEDGVGRFIDECLVEETLGRIPVSDLRSVYDTFCADQGLSAAPWKDVTERLSQRGAVSKSSNGQRAWHGFALKTALASESAPHVPDSTPRTPECI